MFALAPLQIHPGAAIFAWLMLAAAAGWAGAAGLAVLTAVAVAVAPAAAFLSALRRLRWLLLALLAVFGYATPGAPVIPALDLYSPTREGLAAGLTQVWRIALVVALLLGATGGMERRRLLSGLYALIAPLARFGVAVERVSVRLSLTLDYAANLARLDTREVLESLAGRELPSHVPEDRVHIDRPRLRARDGLALAVAAALAWAALVGGPAAGDWVTGLA